MNEDTIAGAGKDVVGKLKETAGDITNDSGLKGEGLLDQFSGKADKAVGAAKDLLGSDLGSSLDRLKQFVREKPFASAAAVGVVGIALLNSLRRRD